MDYGDAEHIKNLEATFMALLDDVDKRQNIWTKLRKKLYKLNDEFKGLLPTQFKKMMILPFTELATIYDTYVALKLSEKNDLYCDMTYINYFQYKEFDKKRTQFDLDHVLDKGRCPLVALSLYNLVPACPTCNGPHIKGKRVMNVTLEQRKKLSPSSTLYDFENQVKIWIRPKTGKIRNTNFLKYMDDYDLDFDTSSDADYENEIDFLYLRERYNYHKCEALRLADLKVKYTSSKIKEIARIICNIGKEEQKELTPIANIMTEQIRRDIFGLEFSNEHHRTFHKLRKDILDFKDEE